MIEKYLDWLYEKVGIEFKEKFLFPNNLRNNNATILEFIDEIEEHQFKKDLEEGNFKGVSKIFEKNPIYYNLNSDGFRTWEEFSEGGDVNIFLGCSNTFGYGSYLEHTWSYKLNEFLSEKNGIKYKYWNLGVPGSGMDTQFRILYQVLKKYGKNINLHNVFHFSPLYIRYEYIFSCMDYKKEEIYPEIIGPFNYGEFINSSFTKNHYISETPLAFNHIKNIEAINSLVKKYNANYKLTSFDYLTDNKVIEYFTDFMYDKSLYKLKSRDNGHISYYDNHKLFSYFVEN